MKPTLLKSLAALALLLGGLLTADAHYVWIEDLSGKRLVVRFAEWPDEYETSPGHLDELTTPDAFKFDTNGVPVPFKIKKKSEYVQIVGATPALAVQVETGFEVLSATNKPSRKPLFYARWQPFGGGAVKPSLNFDIVPTDKSGEYRVFFRTEPVPGAKVTAHLPSGKEEDLVADDQGIVRFTGEKPGLYMLSCKYQRESVKGFSGGRPYDLVSHNCSITWRQP